VTPIEECIDHRVLEMRAPPPCDEAIGRALPALVAQERSDRIGEALLHVDNGAVLVEGQGLDLAFEDVRAFHAGSPWLDGNHTSRGRCAGCWWVVAGRRHLPRLVAARRPC